MSDCAKHQWQSTQESCPSCNAETRRDTGRIKDYEAQLELWMKRARTFETEITDLRGRMEALAEKVKQTRTAWLEQHGVPISQEFVDFANALGDLLEAAIAAPAGKGDSNGQA